MSSDHAGGAGSPNHWHADQADHSIDSIIGWLRQCRAQRPAAPLRELLEHKSLGRDCLIDVACIDLIGRRRSGQATCVEDYLRDFPELADDLACLDLIDAEICVDREMGKSPTLELLVKRFPDLHSQISDLVEMDPIGPQDLALISASTDGGRRESGPEQSGVIESSKPESLALVLASMSADEKGSGDASLDFSIAEASVPKQRTPSPSSPPIDVPDWFVGERCVASGPGHWLIRGRDAVRGETLAMKVIQLPLQVTHAEVQQLMDACEKAAKVRNPAWVLPAVAAVQDRHLAVIRNWVFANPWQHGSRITNPTVRLRQLSLVAYALQSAHSVGAVHGGIHASNLLIDHQGRVQVVDGSSTKAIVKRWFESGDGFAPWSQRQRLDVQDMIKLVVTDVVDWSSDWADGLVSQLRAIADRYPAEACGRIGDALLRWADDHHSGQPPAKVATASRTSFRRRLAGWIAGMSR